MAEDDQSCDNSFHSAKSELSQIIGESNKQEQLHSSISTQVLVTSKRKSSEETNTSREGISEFNISSEQEDSWPGTAKRNQI